VRLPVDVCEKLAQQAGGSNHIFTVNLETQTVTAPDGEIYTFDVDPGRKSNLLQGLDEIGASLQAEGDINAYEATRKVSMPWLETAR
jgi:3-isopropylmalate/(R)-2-methylmalate dehydratase small subunit